MAAAATAALCAGCKRKREEPGADERMELLRAAIAKRAEGKSAVAISTAEDGVNFMAAELDELEVQLHLSRAETYDLKAEVQELKERLAGRAPAVSAAVAAAVADTRPSDKPLWVANRTPFHHKADSISIRAWVRAACGLDPFFTRKAGQREGVLDTIYQLYDQKHDNAFSRKLEAVGKIVTFDWNSKLQSSAGRMRLSGNTFTIQFSTRIFFDEVTAESVKEYTSGGLVCDDRLTALLLVFEHELVHMLLTLDAPPDEPAHGALFMNVLNNLFGQITKTHGLIRNEKQLADGTFHRFKPGDRVSFEFGKRGSGRTEEGVVDLITHSTIHVITDAKRRIRCPFKRATLVSSV